MSGDPAKDFAAIREDYAFFETHATEAAADVRAYLPLLAPLLEGNAPVRLLDFGCGSGRFSSRLHSTLFIPPERLHLALVEPDSAGLRRAHVSMLDFTAHPILCGTALPAGLSNAFDVVLANHVFYYVADLENELKKILGALAHPGLLLATMAGRDNALIRFWEAGFALVSEAIPYHTAEDVRARLRDAGREVEERTIFYELAFADSEENRWHIVRFLFGEHLARILAVAGAREQLLGLFEPFASKGRVQIGTSHQQFIVRT